MTNKAFSFADRLRLLREDRGLSKTALAKLLGLTTTCVWSWEEGNTEPRSENLRALSKALNAPVDYLQAGADWEGAPSVGGEAKRRSDVGLTLPEVIAEAKLRIAQVAKVTPEKINISLEY